MHNVHVDAMTAAIAGPSIDSLVKTLGTHAGRRLVLIEQPFSTLDAALSWDKAVNASRGSRTPAIRSLPAFCERLRDLAKYCPRIAARRCDRAEEGRTVRCGISLSADHEKRTASPIGRTTARLDLVCSRVRLGTWRRLHMQAPSHGATG